MELIKFSQIASQKIKVEAFQRLPGVDSIRLQFPNQWVVSILKGEAVCSNGIDTYEVAIFNPGNIMCTREFFIENFDEDIYDDIVGWQSDQEVQRILEAVSRQ